MSEGLRRILLPRCFSTRLEFDERRFEVEYCGHEVRIVRDPDNWAKLTLKDQRVPYKATILGSYVTDEEVVGEIAYADLFTVDWQDDLIDPVINFRQRPTAVVRNYLRGQRIELGIEEVSEYHVEYDDGVEAWFVHVGEASFEFRFSTGFYGRFGKEPDGSYTLNFRGDKLDPEEDELSSQSKFVVTRSKYTDNLVLILQDDARVTLT